MLTAYSLKQFAAVKMYEDVIKDPGIQHRGDICYSLLPNGILRLPENGNCL